MALLSVLGQLRQKQQFHVTAHGVNHGLRAEALDELARARAVAKAMKVPFSITSVSVAAGGNLQARARTARYRALEAARIAVGADFIVTAHHAEDRAETVMLRLLRGTGPRGLAVLRPKSGLLLRPMVRGRRAQIRAHLERHRVPFSNDPSNENRRFLRVRVRNELMPMLESLSPQIVEHLCSLADQSAQEGDEPLTKPDGNVSLGRTQQEALRRALRQGLFGTRIALGGGLELSLNRVAARPKSAQAKGPR
jgi:tRNA(Ile)-lysidine synthase